MKKPQRLPKCPSLTRQRAAVAAKKALGILRRFLLLIAVAGASAGLALAFVAPMIYEAGQHATFPAAFDLARAEIQAEMREACPCWFEDSRCSKPGAIVVCTMPEWMRSEPTGE